MDLPSPPSSSWTETLKMPPNLVKNKARDQWTKIISLKPNNPDLRLIDLSIGNPAVSKEFQPHPIVFEALKQVLGDPKAHSYHDGTGSLGPRQDVATYMSTAQKQYAASDIILTAGCSHSIQFALQTLCGSGNTVLLPRPGFPLYEAMCDFSGFKKSFYKLDPKNEWKIDLAYLETILTPKTKALLITNPGNPTGAVFPKAHLVQIIDFCEKHKIALISDEVYNYMVYPSVAKTRPFLPIASLSKSVPVLTCTGLSKQFLIPGWRFGWLAIHDPLKKMEASGMINYLKRLGNLLIAPNVPIQFALKKIFTVPQEFHDSINLKLQVVCKIIEQYLDQTFVEPCPSQGALYKIAKLNLSKLDFSNDIEFVETLWVESSVRMMPCSLFGLEGFVRIVLCTDPADAKVFCERINQFCKNHQISTL